ncbi:MAG: hypothetical protein IPN76_03970 [Saprospiraceae bacterium]|nr:hypothetical protein [Saprospiraceae bacterium]
MGAWGTAIFSDAADVRDDFKDKTANGKTPLDATNEMIAENQAILEDNDDAAVFWLSLAAAQWKLEIEKLEMGGVQVPGLLGSWSVAF